MRGQSAWMVGGVWLTAVVVGVLLWWATGLSAQAGPIPSPSSTVSLTPEVLPAPAGRADGEGFEEQFRLGGETGNVADLFLSDTTLFVAQDTRVVVLNVENITAPAPRAVLGPFSNPVVRVRVDEVHQRLYVLLAEGTVYIFDLNASPPNQVGILEGASISALEVGPDNTLWTLVGDQSFVVFDVAQPAAPRVLGTLALPRYTQALLADTPRGYAYVLAGGNLYVIRMAAVSQPQVVDTIAVCQSWPGGCLMDGRGTRVDFAGWQVREDTLYVLLDGILAQVPILPDGELGNPTFAYLQGSHFFVSDVLYVLQENRLRVYTLPVEGWVNTLAGLYEFPTAAQSIVAQGNTVFVGTTRQVYLLKREDLPASSRESIALQKVATFPDPADILHILRSLDRAYLITPTGLSIYATAPNATPTLLARLDHLWSPVAAALQGQYVYLVDQVTGQFLVVEVTDDRPQLVGYTFLPAPSSSMVVQGDWVYLGGDMLTVVNVRDPASPYVAATLDTVRGAVIGMKDTYLYIGATNALQVVDVNTPAQPYVITRQSLSSFRDGAIHGSWLFVLEEDTLSIWDISGPPIPLFPISTYLFRHVQPRAIATMGQYLYLQGTLPNGRSTILAYPLQGPRLLTPIATYEVAGDVKAWSIVERSVYVALENGPLVGLRRVVPPGNPGCYTSLGGVVYHDLNGDGMFSPGEPRRPRITVRVSQVSGPYVAYVRSTANGWWQVTEVPEGTYRVEVIPPSGWTARSPAFHQVEVIDPCQQTLNLHFGLVPAASPTPTPTPSPTPSPPPGATPTPSPTPTWDRPGPIIPNLETELTLEPMVQVGGDATTMVITGTWGIVAVGPRVQIVNLDDPERPQVVAETPPLPQPVVDLTLGPGVVYVAANWEGIWILDISTPEQPRWVSRFATEWPVIEVAYQDGMVYAVGAAVTDYALRSPYEYFGGTLYVLDASDPVRLKLSTRLEERGFGLLLATPNALYALRPLNIFAWPGGLFVVPLADGRLGPPIFYEVEDTLWPPVAALNGRYLFYGVREGIRVYDIRNPVQPFFLGFIPAQPKAILATDERLFIVERVDGSYRLRVLAPATVGTFVETAVLSLPERVQGIVADPEGRPYVYVLTAGGILPIHIASEEVLQPAPFRRLSPCSGLQSVAYRDGRVWVGCDRELVIFRLGEEENPARWRRVPFPATIRALEVVGQWVYVVTGPPATLTVLRDNGNDIITLSTLQLAETLYPTAITVAEGKAFITVPDRWMSTGTGGLYVVDVREPTQPQILHRIDPGSRWLDVAVRDGWIYGALDRAQGTPAGLTIGRIEGDRITILTRWRPPGWICDAMKYVSVGGPYLYVVQEGGGSWACDAILLVVDVSDPERPVLVESRDIDYRAGAIIDLSGRVRRWGRWLLWTGISGTWSTPKGVPAWQGVAVFEAIPNQKLILKGFVSLPGGLSRPTKQWDVALGEQRVYVTAGPNGLYVYQWPMKNLYFPSVSR